MAKKRVGKFSKAFRQMAVDRLNQCENIGELAKELGIHRRLLYAWREKLEPLERSEGAPATSREVTLRKEISHLKRVLAEKVWRWIFQRCLAQRRGATPAERQDWRAGIYAQIRAVMSRQGGLRIEQMCQLVQVSRASFYRPLQEARPVDEAMLVRAEIQQIALAHRRRYGYRRITAELRRRGLLVNHKRVARLMRADNLLAIQPRAFVVTTDAQHDLAVCLNLPRRLTLTGINRSGWRTSPIFNCTRSSSTWRSSWMGSRARWWDGHWGTRWSLACHWGRCATRLPLASRRQASCITRIGASSTPRASTCRSFKTII